MVTKSIINTFNQWFDKHDCSINLPRYITRQMLQLNGVKEFCLSFPTCEGCPFKEKHIGCLFKNKTPREW
jgi:hypothetical protein